MLAEELALRGMLSRVGPCFLEPVYEVAGLHDRRLAHPNYSFHGYDR